MLNKMETQKEINLNVHAVVGLLVELNNRSIIKTKEQEEEVLNEVKTILMRLAIYEEEQYFEVEIKKAISEFDLTELSEDFKKDVYRLLTDPLSKVDLLKSMEHGEDVLKDIKFSHVYFSDVENKKDFNKFLKHVGDRAKLKDSFKTTQYIFNEEDDVFIGFRFDNYDEAVIAKKLISKFLFANCKNLKMKFVDRMWKIVKTTVGDYVLEYCYNDYQFDVIQELQTIQQDDSKSIYQSIYQFGEFRFVNTIVEEKILVSVMDNQEIMTYTHCHVQIKK